MVGRPGVDSGEQAADDVQVGAEVPHQVFGAADEAKGPSQLLHLAVPPSQTMKNTKQTSITTM